MCVQFGAGARAQSHDGHHHGSGKHQLRNVPIHELNKVGELPEISIGGAIAKITRIEFMSMS